MQTEDIFFIENDVVDVVIPYNLGKAYAYKVPKQLKLKIGDCVKVFLGKKEVVGVIFSKNTATEINFELKYIQQKVDSLGSLSETMIKFVIWVAKYNMANIGTILKMVIPLLEDTYKQNEIIYSLSSNFSNKNIKITPKRQEIIDTLKQGNLSANQIKSKKLSINIINILKKEGIIETNTLVKETKGLQDNIFYNPIVLTKQQKECSNILLDILKENKFSTTLLDGVPGSGKTEVYFELINYCINNDKQVLVMLPEIALSSQWLERFKARFNVEPYIWHSDINKKQKKITYYDIINNKVKVLVGTRSSLFLPYNKLGLIIIDEEHDGSYKQEEKCLYNARDMAVIRAKMFNIPLVLASATPSIETFYNVKINKYKYVKLESRYNKAPMPVVKLINMKDKENKPKFGKYISPLLVNELSNNLKQQEQSLLFINRRGYAPINICSKCNEKVGCPNCSSYLVEHRFKNSLVCHYCGFTTRISKHCSNKDCLAEDSIISFAPGVERIAEEIKELFPNAKVAIASSDSINSYNKAKNLVQEILNNNIDIIIGTQLIAKGYHFPNLSLVGVVDGDIGLFGLDLKANEKAWQVLYQVSGRAGREQKLGRVFIQSYNLDNPVITSLVNFNRDEFLNYELLNRKNEDMPPLSKFAGIIISSSKEDKLKEFCSEMARLILPKYKSIDEENYIVGPIPAAIYKLRNQYRLRFLVKTKKEINIQNFIKDWLNKINIPSFIKLKIDIDPINFY